jgi:hypothetical protein
MLQRRGYTDIVFTDHDQNGSKPRLVACKDDDGISVFFVEKNKVTIQVFKAILTISDYKHIIFVHAMGVTSDARQSIETCGLYKFEVFTFDEMSYDVIELVVPHTLETTKPKEWSKLPIILSTDIVARYYHFRPGDIVAIKEGAITSLRRCV